MKMTFGKLATVLILEVLFWISAQAQNTVNIGSTPLQVSAAITPAIPDSDLKAIGELLQQYVTTFSAQNFNAHLKLYHFPTVRFADGKVAYFRSLKDVPSNDLRTGMTGDFKSSDWASLEIIQAGPTKVHIVAVFRRLRKDGQEISRVSGLYIIEKVKDRWGVRARSTF